jgi:hypothetical protein
MERDGDMIGTQSDCVRLRVCLGVGKGEGEI